MQHSWPSFSGQDQSEARRSYIERPEIGAFRPNMKRPGYAARLA
jgi:hypothetical protein